MTKRSFLTAAMLALAGLSNSFAQVVIIQPGPQFQMDKFEQNIREALDGKAIGYAYAINQNGLLKKSGANGWARTFLDLPPGYPNPWGVPQSANKRMNIASISKPITAATVHKIIQDKLAPGYPNLTVNSKVLPFLPKPWVKGPGVANLTFAELLSQYSGMFDNGGDTSTTGLKTWIANGVTRAKSDYIYINGNLAIFRIIIPYMMLTQDGRDLVDAMATGNPALFSTYCGDAYKQTVRTLLFQPMGIANADMKPGETYPTLLYTTLLWKNGSSTGDWTESGGGGGWYLSAVDLARFLAHLRYNDIILKPATRSLMDNLANCPGANCRMLGWQPPVEGDHGVYYFHGGSLNYGSEPKNGMSGVIINFPYGVQAALLINSLGTYEDKKVLIRKAFDAAWQ